ncbi:MAG: efflux RND transporter periplasmic adaptor subunit [bacterium]
MTLRISGLFAIVCLLGFLFLVGCGDKHQADDGHDHGAEEAATEDGHDHGAEEAATEDGHDHGAEEAATEDGHDHGAEEAEAGQGHDHDTENAILHLDGTAMANLGVQIRTAELKTHYERIKIPGSATVDPDRQVVVSLPTTVRILKLNAPPHATVSAGDRLAELELVDPQFNQLQIHAVETRAELIEARTNLERNRTYLTALQSNGSQNPSEQRRVEADLTVLQARVESLQSGLTANLAALEMAGMSHSQREALERDGSVAASVTVYAPRLPGSPDLEVAIRPVIQGETVAAGAILFQLVALDELLVIGDAFESDLPIVSRAAREGLPVSLLFPAENRTVEGLRILALEGALDGVERITHFFVKLPNRPLSEKTEDGVRYVDWQNRAGARVQILVATQMVGLRFVIPAAAVVRDGEHAWIFRRIYDGFERLDITVEAWGQDLAVLPLECGLMDGDEIAVSGALQLNLLTKQQQNEGSASDDSGHGHAH